MKKVIETDRALVDVNNKDREVYIDVTSGEHPVTKKPANLYVICNAKTGAVCYYPWDTRKIQAVKTALANRCRVIEKPDGIRTQY